MALHARNIAILAGATGAQVEAVAKAIAAEGRVSVDAAKEKLATM
jgi:hydroxymethylglutaryl-CoA reductase